jgi:microcystin-dependent protein
MASAPFVAEIRIFPFKFAPTGWAACDGQLMPLAQNTALFSLLGVTYGGDGKSNFALPNLQGCVPLEQGQGPGLSLYDLGQSGGTETVTLTTLTMPAHPHTFGAASTIGDVNSPSPQVSLARSNNATAYVADSSQNIVQLAQTAINFKGNSQPHNNMQPYLTLNFCIALQGVYPPRT